VGAVRARPEEGSSPGSSKTWWQAGRRELRDAECPYARPPQPLCAACRCHAIEIARLAVYVAAYLRIYVADVSVLSPVRVKDHLFLGLLLGLYVAEPDVLRTARNAAQSVSGRSARGASTVARDAHDAEFLPARVEWGPPRIAGLLLSRSSFGTPTILSAARAETHRSVPRGRTRRATRT
jgi:hypothetical protein